MKIAKLALVLPGLLALNLHAQTSDSTSYHPFTLGPEIGTTGYGGFATYRFMSHLGVTGGFDYFNYTENGSIKNVAYSVKARLQSEPVALSLYPSADSSFHLNLGVVFNQFRVTRHQPRWHVHPQRQQLQRHLELEHPAAAHISLCVHRRKFLLFRPRPSRVGRRRTWRHVYRLAPRRFDQFQSRRLTAMSAPNGSRCGNTPATCISGRL